MKLKFLCVIIIIFYISLKMTVNCINLDKIKNVLRSNWKENLKKLKDKMKEIYRQKTLHPHEIVGIGPKPSSELDFPKKDEKKLLIIQNMWSDYYACLEMQNKIIAEDKTIPPQAINVFASENIRLDCNLCISPKDVNENAQWFFSGKIFGQPMRIVEEDENIQISPYEYTLNIFNAQQKHQGVYMCQIGISKDAPYFVHISTNEEPVDEIKPNEILKETFSVNIPNTDFVIWNEWSEWSECSWCGPVGRRKRTGHCKITLLKNLPQNISSKIQTPKDKIKIPNKIKNITEKLLSSFVYGIPCRSKLLPKTILEERILQNFASQVTLGYCKEPCPGEVIIEVMDKTGRVIQTLNNTAGEYSTLQKIPGIPPAPERLKVYISTNTSTILRCPGNLYNDSPFEWSTSGIRLKPDVIKLLSDDRIKIDDMQQMIFKRAIPIDSKVYSCWQRKELAGVVILQVTDKYKIDPVFVLNIIRLYAVIPVFCVFVYVIIRIRMDREKAKIAAKGDFSSKSIIRKKSTADKKSTHR